MPRNIAQQLRIAEGAIDLARQEIAQARAQRDEAVTAQQKAEQQMKKVEHKAKLLEIVQKVASISDEYGLGQITAAVTCMKTDRGCNTPTEEFIASLLLHYSFHGFLTPEDIEHDFGEFRASYQMMVRDGVRFVQNYEKIAAKQIKEPAE